MPVPLIAAGIGGLTSIVGGALAGRSKTSTQTSTSTPTWSPEFSGLKDSLMNYSQDLMNNPAKGLDPIRTASADRINRRYAALPGKISQNMAARGYGSSGNFGNTMYQSEFARSGEMSDLDSLMAQLQLDQQNRGASLGQQLLAQGRGTTTTGTGTAPGDVGGSAFGTAGNALSNVASMLMMSKILKGGLDDPNKTTIRF